MNKVKTAYEALRNGVMVYMGNGYGVFRVSGRDSALFLDKLSAKDIQYMNVGMVSECFFLTESAAVIARVFVIREEKDFLVITDAEQREDCFAWMQEKAGEYSAVITDISDSESVLAMEGPFSWKLLKEQLVFPVEELALRTAVNREILGETCTVARVGYSGEYGYMVLAGEKQIEKIHSFIFDHTADLEYSAAEGNREALYIAMLETHQPNFHYETPAFGNLVELEQQWLIQYDKDDFIGRDALVKLVGQQGRKHSAGFVMDGENVPAAGTPVIGDDEEIGKVVYAMYSFALEKVLGIAVFRDPYGVSGITCSLTDGTRIHTISSPFVRSTSWDMKME